MIRVLTRLKTIEVGDIVVAPAPNQSQWIALVLEKSRDSMLGHLEAGEALTISVERLEILILYTPEGILKLVSLLMTPTLLARVQVLRRTEEGR